MAGNVARIDARTLAGLSMLLDELRAIPGLTEAKPGIFYLKRVPMLHFHQTDAGIAADLKRVSPRVAGFDRFALRDRGDQQALANAAAERCRVLQKKKSP